MAYQASEKADAYCLGGFHPVHLGDVYNSRYEVLRKLGFGRFSTVWLVKDKQNDRYKALKILSAECYNGSKDIFELEILKRLRDSNPKHLGYQHISKLFGSFIHIGPNGRHICLVLEPMAESLASFGALFPKSQIPSNIVRRFTRQLLLALDYAHESGIIHTDIQPRNIMIQLKDASIISNFLEETPANTSSADNSAIATQSLRDFYIRDLRDLADLDITLSDWGSASWIDKHLTELIQPILLRAPEVLIEAPWGPPVDIWNLGAVLIEVLDAVRMFNGLADQRGDGYWIKYHLEEIVALFGDIPPKLLAQGNQTLIAEYFDEHGKIRDPLPRPKAYLEHWIESLDGVDKTQFIALLKSMMVVEPGNRKTAKGLLDETWLQ